MPTIELKIGGKVQGVFYRASAKEKALGLGLTGWVKNEEDGSVCIRASGTAEALDALAEWCAKGPAGAKVLFVERKNLPEQSFNSFTILR